MEKPQFVYVTYIRSTPEKVWSGLTDPEVTRLYWGHWNVSDWKPGSVWEHRVNEGGAVNVTGRVLESDPPRRLVMTWAAGADAEREAGHSRVTFEIEPWHGTVRLTVVHDRFEPGSDMQKGVSIGWPMVLCSLKSLLESSDPLPMSIYTCHHAKAGE